MVVPGQNVWFLFCALGVIVVGNGLFKANAGNLVRKIYEGDDSRIDSAFTIYYMAVNLGAMFSQLLTPWLKDYFNEQYGNGLGWHVAFGVCAFGLVLGLLNYAVMRHTMAHIGSEPDERPVALRQARRGAGDRRRRGIRRPPTSCSTRRSRACSSISPASSVLGIFALPDRDRPAATNARA